MESNVTSTYSLKAKSIGRLVTDMIRDTKITAGEATFVVLIVDDYSAQILSSFMSMSEVLNEGIFSVEQLHSKRQPFPKYQALYFISPTGISCDRLAEDFKDESRPMYSRIHIFFTHRIMEVTLERIVNPGVMKRTATCKELNLSFFIRDKNLYDLGIENDMRIFSANKDDQSMNLSNIMERLFTVCAVLKEFPHVQYQKSSILCTRLAQMLNAELKLFYSTKTINDRKGILLVTDRTLDPTSPLLHDYNWETIVYDLFPIKQNMLDFDNKKSKLDECDELWMQYKNMHIVQVFDRIKKDFEDFMQSDLSKVGKSENMESFDEMADVLSKMKDYKTKTALFSLHLKMAEEVSNKYNQMNLYDIIELEQDIVTGLNEKGDKVANKDIFKTYSLLKPKLLKQPNDILRLICAIHTCLDIPEKDFNVVAGNMENDKNVISNLSYLGISFANTKSKTARRENVVGKKEKIKVQLKKQLDYNTLRSSPKIETIVEQCSKYELPQSDFPFVEEPTYLPKVNAHQYGTSNLFLGGKDDSEEEDIPVLIIFNIGGIAHNEITALERLMLEKRVSHRLVIGSTSIQTASDYIEQLRNLKTEGSVVLDVKGKVKVDPREIELKFK